MGRFILHPEHKAIRGNCIVAIQELDESVTWDVSIKRHVNSKTAEQRSWFHVLLGLFAEQVGMAPGDLKEVIKAKVSGWKTVSYGGVELVMAAESSEKLNRDRYSGLIEQTYILAGEAGIVLPPADRFRREA